MQFNLIDRDQRVATTPNHHLGETESELNDILRSSSYHLQLNYSTQLTGAAATRWHQSLVVTWQCFLHLALSSIYGVHSNTFVQNATKEGSQFSMQSDSHTFFW